MNCTPSNGSDTPSDQILHSALQMDVKASRFPIAHGDAQADLNLHWAPGSSVAFYMYWLTCSFFVRGLRGTKHKTLVKSAFTRA